MISFSRNVSFYLPGIRRFQNIQTSNICHWENQARNNSSKTSDRTETYKRTNVVCHVRHVIYFNELLLTFRDRWPSLFIEAVRWKGRGGEGMFTGIFFTCHFENSLFLSLLLFSLLANGNLAITSITWAVEIKFFIFLASQDSWASKKANFHLPDVAIARRLSPNPSRPHMILSDIIWFILGGERKIHCKRRSVFHVINAKQRGDLGEQAWSRSGVRSSQVHIPECNVGIPIIRPRKQ